MTRRVTNRRGIALLLVLVMVVVTSVLGMTYASITTVKARGAANVNKAARARYLAESGLHHGLYLLRTGSQALEGTDADNPWGPLYADGTDDSYEIWIEPLGSLQYRICARGRTGGLVRRSSMTVELTNDYREKVLALGPQAYWRLGEIAGTTAADQMTATPGTYVNEVTLGQSGVVMGDLDRAALFDGTNDHVDLGGMDVSGWGLTVVGWFRADSFSCDDARIVSKADGIQTADHYWMLSTIRTGGRMRLRGRVGAGWSAVTLSAWDGDLTENQWVFGAMTFDGFWMRLYKDAQEVGTRFKFGWLWTDEDVPAWIGGNPDSASSRPFDGLIDEVAIFNRALTQEQLESLYESRTAKVDVLSWDEP